MAICKFCGAPFQWGRSPDKWVPLVPLGEEGDLPRTFQDAEGNLRAEHRPVCTHAPAVDVVKLSMPVLAEHVFGREEDTRYDPTDPPHRRVRK